MKLTRIILLVVLVMWMTSSLAETQKDKDKDKDDDDGDGDDDDSLTEKEEKEREERKKESEEADIDNTEEKGYITVSKGILHKHKRKSNKKTTMEDEDVELEGEKWKEERKRKVQNLRASFTKRNLTPRNIDMDAVEEFSDAEIAKILGTAPSRRKRFVYSSTSTRWTGGVVPYVLDSGLSAQKLTEIASAMGLYERHTCIRFVPWDNGAAKTTYGLDHDGYLYFLHGSGCYSFVGNTRNSDGQDISCCDRYPCLHELGHALGVTHEHQSPVRNDWIRVNWEEIKETGWSGFKRKDPSDYRQFGYYDISSILHYSAEQFNKNGGLAWSSFFTELTDGDNTYYPFYEISTAHDCKAFNCPSFSTVCANRGYVSVDGASCYCVCPYGLDSATGCTTTITAVPSVSWPGGAFGLLGTTSGCANNGFSTGETTQASAGSSWQSTNFHAGGSFQPDSTNMEFCVMESSSNTGEWPAGAYCIHRVGGVCPDGFQEGFIQFDDDTSNQTNSRSGSLPDGEMTGDTLFDFCCRNDGFIEEDMALPHQHSFILYRHGGTCHPVKGMFMVNEFYWYSNVKDSTFATVSGSHPDVYQTSSAMWRIDFCYYEPVNYGCGGMVELTSVNPSEIITSPNYPGYDRATECNWVVKAPPNVTILVNFNDMDIEISNDECLSYLDIRTYLLGQPGIRICGDGMEQSIRTISNMLGMTFRSTLNGGFRGFNLTATILTQEEHCFDLESEGHNYRGKVNYTRDMQPCLHWTEVTNCTYNALDSRYAGYGLDNDYCRNPPGSGQRPWCYTGFSDDAGCLREYCDVCLYENRFDTNDDCVNLAANSKFCSTDPDAFEMCALTCSHFFPEPDVVKVGEVLCEPPVIPQDGMLVGTPKTTYTLGETVEVQCTSSPDIITATCLTDGSWSLGNFVCGVCDEGWAPFNGHCYKYFAERATFPNAISRCQEFGAIVAPIENEEVHAYILSLREFLFGIWLGADDKVEDTTWVWQDGTPATYFNWETGEPSNANQEDCAFIQQEIYNSTWMDTFCTGYFPFVCRTTPAARTECADLKDICGDILEQNPKSCQLSSHFVHYDCSNTCGLCSASTCSLPQQPEYTDVVMSPVGSILYTGEYVEYACAENHVHTAGQLVRACRVDGEMTGTSPVCTHKSELPEPTSDVELISRVFVGRQYATFTGPVPEFTITRSGEITEWRFFSKWEGKVALQVWRRVNDTSYTFLGQNAVETGVDRVQRVAIAPRDRIDVEIGDYLGVHFDDPRGGITFENCNNSLGLSIHTPGGLGRSSSSYVLNTNYDFANDTRQCRRFSLIAIIADIALTCDIPQTPDNAELISSHVGAIPAGENLEYQCVTDFVHSAGDIVRPCNVGGWLSGDSPVCTHKSIPTPINSVSLTDRQYVGSQYTAFTGPMPEFTSLRPGEVIRWQFFSRFAGKVALQVWRKVTDTSYRFIGQNEIDTEVNRTQTIEISPENRIHVEIGDFIGIYYPNPRGGVTFDPCDISEGESVQSGVIANAAAFVEGQNYDFTNGAPTCRQFSLNAYIGEIDTTCTVPPNPSNTQLSTSSPGDAIAAGQNLQYACADGHILDSGLLVRSCQLGGFFTGDEPVCVEASVETTVNNVPLTDRQYVGSQYTAFTGPMPEFSISREGEITQWQFYSRFAGKVALQVWRQVTDTRYTFIGQNEIDTEVDQIQTIEISPENRIHVEVGDFIGIYYPNPRGGVTFDPGCNDGESVQSGVIANADEFVEGDNYDFTNGAPTCRRFSLNAYIGEIDTTCTVPPNPSNTQLSTSSPGDAIAAGQNLQYACADGHILDSGLLVRSCQLGGFFTGDEPVCVEASVETTVNNVPLTDRQYVGSQYTAFTGPMPEFSISREGEITQWQFYSRFAGKVALQVWRQVTDTRYTFIGQNEIDTEDNQIQTIEISPENRIHVEVGDFIGIYYPNPRGGVTFDPGCNDGESVQSGVISYAAEFVEGHNYDFTNGAPTCRRFSFNAYIGEIATTCTVPPNPSNTQLSTSSPGDAIAAGQNLQYACADGHILDSGLLVRSCQLGGFFTGDEPVCVEASVETTVNNVPLTDRQYVGSQYTAFTGPMPEFSISREGEITQWQFYSRFAGKVALQVWRQVTDTRYTFIGQNEIDTEDNQIQTIEISTENRIHVEVGDFIGIYYPNPRGGVTFDPGCNDGESVQSGVISYAAEFVEGHNYDFTNGAPTCRRFSLNAYIGEIAMTCTIPSNPADSELISAPAGSVSVGESLEYQCANDFILTDGQLVRTCQSGGWFDGSAPVCLSYLIPTPINNVDLITRVYVGSKKLVFTGPLDEFIIKRSGEITEWKFYSKWVGQVSLQVWRMVSETSFTFIGQNDVTTIASGIQTVTVNEGERIPVEIGDVIGVYYGVNRGGLPWQNCNDSDDSDGWSVRAVSGYSSSSAFTAGNNYAFKASTKRCRKFSVTGTVGPRLG